MPYDPELHGPRRVVGPGFHARVWSIVATVPRGRVTTYGDVAGALGARSVARQVGFALAALPAARDDVPWHRVVNGAGRISMRADGGCCAEQLRRLRAEGIDVDARTGRIAGFARVRFCPSRASRSATRPNPALWRDSRTDAEGSERRERRR